MFRRDFYKNCFPNVLLKSSLVSDQHCLDVYFKFKVYSQHHTQKSKSTLEFFLIFLPLWISSVVTSLSFREQKTIHTHYYVCCNQSHRLYLLGDARLLHLQKSRSKEKVRYCLICFREMCLRDDDVMSGKTTDARFSSSRLLCSSKADT